MEVELVRMVADALVDAETGLAAILALVPRDGSDPLPGTPVIYDSTRHDWVARGEEPRQLVLTTGAIAVFLATDHIVFNGRGRPSQTATTIDTAIEVEIGTQLYLKNSDAAGARASGSYLLRALLDFYDVLAQPAQASMRLRGGVRLDTLMERRRVAAFQRPEDAMYSAGVIATWTVRALSPTYA